ncbi:MAG: DegQ family serine endoprotease [Methylococcales bacterium]
MRKKSFKFLNVFLVLLLCFSNLKLAYAGLPTSVGGQALPSLAPMLEKSMPAVVNISTTKNVQVRDSPLMRDPFFRHFFKMPRQQQQQKNSLGSGVIVDKEKGYVLTNNHVIDKADKIMVILNDGRHLSATLLGTDPEADVAVLQIPADNLTELPIANSNKLKVGDFVVAIGNPFGLGQTVTSGIVSALGRAGLGIEGYEDFIQTDASINPGNSGGALVNLRGELVGMNTAILAPSGGNIGIGFAIPSNMVMTLKKTLVKHGKVKRGLLGVATQDLTPELVKAFDLKNSQGAVVSKVNKGSAADTAGIETGDIFVALNGKKVKNSHQIRNIVGLLQVGEKVEIELVRGQQTKTIVATIGKQPTLEVDGKRLHQVLTGVTLAATPRGQVEGVLFSKIKRNSYAWRSGLRPGDIIVSANQYRVRNLKQLKQVVDPRQALLINIQRGSEAFFLVLQ